MSKYTTQVRFICEQQAGLSESVGYSDVDSVIAAAAPKIFDFDFPIFDEAYRSELETKILKHFYLREIGAETYGVWHLWLAERLQTIMPGMNKLYNSNLLEFDPFYDVDLTTERTGSETGTSSETTEDEVTGSGSSSGTAWNLHSDTPQGGITGLDNGNYLSSADKDTSEGTTETSSSSSGSRSGETSGSSTYVERIYGKRGGTSYAKMLEELRSSFLNVDQLIFDALEDLFMGLW